MIGLSIDEKNICRDRSRSGPGERRRGKLALGIEFPEAPNLDVVRIDVRASGITDAEGAWPHPRGLIEVKWHIEEGRRVFDFVRAPAGVRVITG